MSTAAQFAASVLGIYFGIAVIGSLAMMVVAGIENERRRRRFPPSVLPRLMHGPLAPRISVCTSAYNESSLIVSATRALLALEYPRLEVVIVNDGSSDTTLDLLLGEFDMRPVDRSPLADLPHQPVRGVYVPRLPLPLVVIDKANGGRSDGLNAALAYARGPLVVFTDADSYLEPDALLRAVRPFMNDPVSTVAVGAGIGIANGCRFARGRIVEHRRPRALLPLFQAIEYDRSFLTGRMAWSALGGHPLLSGAFGLYRRDAVVAAGGLDKDTIGEDFDLTLRLHHMLRKSKRPYRMVQVRAVACWTIAPATLRVLRRQRKRWQRGLIQVLWKHRRLPFNPKYRTLGLLTLPWFVGYELAAPVMQLAGFGLIVAGVTLGHVAFTTALLVAAVGVLAGVVPSLGAFAMTESPAGTRTGWRELAAVVGAALIEPFIYHPFTLLFRLQAMMPTRRPVAWGDMERPALAPTGSHITGNTAGNERPSTADHDESAPIPTGEPGTPDADRDTRRRHFRRNSTS